MSAYAAEGEPICGEPYPLGGKPCQLPPDHWDKYPHHARPASGGFDAWHPVSDDCEFEDEEGAA